MATIFDPNENEFDDVTHDESAGLQNATNTPSIDGDDDDNDISLDDITIELTALANLGLTATPIGAARNQVLTFVEGADAALKFRLSDGADGNGTDPLLDSELTSLTTTADLDEDGEPDPITLVRVNDTTIFGYANYGEATQRVAFALILQPIAPTATVPGGANILIIQYEAIHHPDADDPDDTLDLSDLVYVDAVQDIAFDDFSDAAAGNNLWNLVTDTATQIQLLFTGFERGTDTVNTSDFGIGSNAQSIGDTDGIIVDFVRGQTTPTQTSADDLANIDFNERVEGPTGGFTLVQVGGGPTNRVNATVVAYDSDEVGKLPPPPDGGTPTDDYTDGSIDGTPKTIISINVWLVSDDPNVADVLVRTWLRDGNQTSGSDSGVSFAIDADGVKIIGLLDNYRVEFAVDGMLDRFSVQNTTGSGGNKTFDIGDIRLGGQEGDTAEVGSHINFEDDGPDATLTLGTASVTHDETAGVQNATATPGVTGDSDDNDQSGALPAVFSGIVGTLIGWARSSAAVVTPTSAYGTDGAGTTVLSLKVDGFTAGNGVLSNLETTNGTAIYLYEEGGLVVGRVGATESAADTGPVAFAISIDSSGFLSTAQYLSLEHPTSPSSYDEAVSLTSTLVKAVLTVTDGDLDVDTAEQNVGDRVRFEDDGPDATLTLGTASVTHDETAGVQNATATPGVTGDSDDNDQSGALPAVFSGIVGTLIGWARSSAAVVTPTSAYGTDGAGTAVLSLKVDGFTPGTGVLSNLETTNGTAIYLYEEGGLVVGRVGATESAADTGPVAFAISIDSSGFLSTAQYLSLEHPTSPSSYDEAVSLTSTLVKAVLTVTDGDLDVDTAEQNVGDRVRFEDDGPSALQPEDGAIENVVGAAETFDLDDDLPNFSANFGSDGAGGLRFTGLNDDAEPWVDGASLKDASGNLLTSNAQQIKLSGFGTSVLTAYVGTDPEATGAKVFTMTLNSDGTYTITMFAKIDDGSFDFDNFATAGAGNFTWVGVSGDEFPNKDLLVTGGNAGVDKVNNDSDDLAIGDQWIDAAETTPKGVFIPAEIIRIDFVNLGIAANTGGKTLDTIDDILSPVTHYDVNNVGFTIMQTQAGNPVDVRITAIDAGGDIGGTDIADDLATGTIEEILSVKIITNSLTAPEGTTYLRSAATEEDVGGVTRLVTRDADTDALLILWDDDVDVVSAFDGSVIVYNLEGANSNQSLLRDRVFVGTDNTGFDRLEISNAEAVNSGHAFAIGDVEVGAAGEDIALEFNAQIVDGDGDANSIDLIGVTVNPEVIV